MRNLFINEIEYKIGADDGSKYGANIKFRKGLNIVYGPNSLGKTSIVTGIIYALGAEKSLGIFKSVQNPFKPEFYDKIDGKNIRKSFVLLEISNSKETITIARSIVGKTNVAGIKKCKLAEFDNNSHIDYYVATGEGTASEGGLQYFLFDFLNLNQVEVPTYEGGISKIYIENIAPLFFVEQRAGWSQIQARQITRYGIREVRKVVFEYLMGLDKFESHLLEIKQKEIKEKIRKHKTILADREDEVLVGINGVKDEDVLLVDRYDIGKTSIHDALGYLKAKYDREIEMLDSLREEEGEISSKGKNQRESLNRTEYQLRKAVNHVNKLSNEIRGYESYIERIQSNKAKNKQLKKIEGLSLDLNINSCPVCESDLQPNEQGECKLCHSELKRKISSPDQNLAFLEDEENSFKEVLKSKRLLLRKSRQAIIELKEKVKRIEETIDHHTKTYIGENMSNLRSKVAELDDLKEEIKRYNWASRKWSELDETRLIIENLEKDKEENSSKLKAVSKSKHDQLILNAIRSHFHSNVRALDLFRDKEHLIAQIKIDESDNYTPYLDSYDIYNIVSSSDNVRIMLSYYLSLLQTSVERTDENVKFPNLLILDEPKQQNLDNKSLKVFIELIEQCDQSKFQVLLTTFSHVEKEKELFEKFICHEMKDSSDYLLKKV